MRITGVEPFLMSYPMPRPLRLPFWGGERKILKRDAMLIRVDTDVGVRGWAPGPAHERAAHEIREAIGRPGWRSPCRRRITLHTVSCVDGLRCRLRRASMNPTRQVLRI